MTLTVFPSLWEGICLSSTGKRWPPLTEADALAFVKRVDQEQLLPVLSEQMDLPEVVQKAVGMMRDVVRAHVARTAQMEHRLRMVATVLKNSGEPFLILKGCDFAYRLYPRPYLRPMVDIDILVPEERMERVANGLVAAGFKRFYPGTVATRASNHHETALGFGNVVVDLHQRFLQKNRHSIDYAAIWRRAETFQWPGFEGLRLSDADAAIYMTISVSLKYFQAPLIRYLDLWLLLQSNKVCLEQAAELAVQWKARRVFYSALRFGMRLFPEFREYCEPVLTGMLSRVTRAFLDRYVVPHGMSAQAGGRRLDQLWKKYWLVDTVALRAKSAVDYAAATLEGLGRVHSSRRTS